MPSNECHVEKIHIKDGTVNIFTRKMLNTMKLLQWCCYILVAITYGQETTTTLSEQNDYPHDNSNLSLSAQSTTHSSSATTSPRKFPEAPLTSDNWHKKSSQLMEVTRKPLKVTKPGDSTIAHVQHCVQKGLILSSKKCGISDPLVKEETWKLAAVCLAQSQQLRRRCIAKRNQSYKLNDTCSKWFASQLFPFEIQNLPSHLKCSLKHLKEEVLPACFEHCGDFEPTPEKQEIWKNCTGFAEKQLHECLLLS